MSVRRRKDFWVPEKLVCMMNSAIPKSKKRSFEVSRCLGEEL
jgi:hypothetical protein